MEDYSTPGARVKAVRQALGMSQKDFAAPLLIGGNSVGFIETGRNLLSERTAAAICQAYNVNPEWLRTGRGEIFKPPATSLDGLAQERGLSDRELDLIRTYMEQPKEVRSVLVSFIETCARRLGQAPEPCTAEQPGEAG